MLHEPGYKFALNCVQLAFQYGQLATTSLALKQFLVDGQYVHCSDDDESQLHFEASVVLSQTEQLFRQPGQVACMTAELFEYRLHVPVALQKKHKNDLEGDDGSNDMKAVLHALADV